MGWIHNWEIKVIWAILISHFGKDYIILYFCVHILCRYLANTHSVCAEPVLPALLFHYVDPVRSQPSAF